ncbi:hypothetical protein DRJ25_06320 [Candidatus Woesearchaeota archaeon]|nr:MAG: hypothetical protein DRJ25_06320 [Candidatus Woesearchaeota archaeon]
MKTIKKEDKEEKYKKYGFEEEYDEESDFNWLYTDFPMPTKRYRAILETFGHSIEESYFWILEHLRDLGAPQFEKITDTTSASELSSFSGMSKQRLGMTQDKIAQYLRGISEISRQLFSQIRELRWIEERLGLYKDSYDKDSKSKESAEISLKGVWIELVEKGVQNPNSVYGLSQKVGFTTLPDLFFGAPPLGEDEIDDYVKTLEFNKKVKDVLAKKLRTYAAWKAGTYKELKQRMRFMLLSLKQTYDTIHMYISWVKPYLKTARRLQSRDKYLDSVDMATAFEGTMVELEFMAKTLPGGKGDVYGVVLVNLLYRTKPDLKASTPDRQHWGPMHYGKLEINWRTYAWTQEEIDNYKAMRAEEDLKYISTIDESVKNAIEGLGDELNKYYTMAQKQLGIDEDKDKSEEEKKEKEKKDNIYKQMKTGLDPFISIFKGFGELFDSMTNFSEIFKPEDPDKKSAKKPGEVKGALGAAHFQAWTCYKNYKKSHGMIAW